MKITLTHLGEVPGNKRPPEKIDAIRQDFHAQLAKLWGHHQLAVLKEWLDSGFAAGAPDYRRKLGGRTYLPIASDRIGARVRLSILLLSGVHPRNPAYHAGDIDNRFKSLIDALSVPCQASLIPRKAPQRDTICLMSDDSLIDELKVRTAPFLAQDNPSKSLAIVEAKIVAGKQTSLDTDAIFL